MQRLIIATLALMVLTGCSSSRYAWNGYDEKLYDYYKSPAEIEKFAERLADIVKDGESENRVPPGLYAEYGYLLFEKGKFAEAAAWFGKEADKWPESQFFMTKMINLANTKGAPRQPTTPPPPTLPSVTRRQP